MDQRCCRFCQQAVRAIPIFTLSRRLLRSALPQQRRTQSRNLKLAVDTEYRQVCRDSARKWRANNPGYWKRYRAAKPDFRQRNRTRQRQRDLRQRVASLANNNSALDLKSSVQQFGVGSVAARSCKQQLSCGASLYLAKPYPQTAPPRGILQTTSLWYEHLACLYSSRMTDELEYLKQRIPLLDYLQQRNWTARRVGSPIWSL